MKFSFRSALRHQERLASWCFRSDLYLLEAAPRSYPCRLLDEKPRAVATENGFLIGYLRATPQFATAQVVPFPI